MNEALPIGFYQLDNLIRSRVPFLLLRTSVDMESVFGVMEKMHLRTWSMILNPMDVKSAEIALQERQARKEDPIVVVCEDGKSSQKLAQELVELGHLNVYFMLGGWKAFLAEMKAEEK